MSDYMLIHTGSTRTTVETLIESGFKPARKIVLSFGFDEEASGVYVSLIGHKYAMKLQLINFHSGRVLSREIPRAKVWTKCLCLNR